MASVITPYGKAEQLYTEEALTLLNNVKNGATLYKIGTLGKSEAVSAQFWSTENPLVIGIENFGKKYGIPAENLKGSLFIETGTILKNSAFVTRAAKNLEGKLTGGFEVVTNPGGVRLETFSTINH